MRLSSCLPAILLALTGCAAQPRAVAPADPVHYDPALLPDASAALVVVQGIRRAPAWQMAGGSGTVVRVECESAKWPKKLREETVEAGAKAGGAPVVCADGVAITCARGTISFTPTDSQGAQGPERGAVFASSPVYARELETLRTRIAQSLGRSFVANDPQR